MESLQNQQNGQQNINAGSANPLSAFRTRQFGGIGKSAAQIVSSAPPVQNNQTNQFDTPTQMQAPTFQQWFDDAVKKNEQQKKIDDKKRKRDEVFAAIGDGISALSNLYFTTKGAPNSFNANNTMSDRTREMYDKINKDREENFNRYVNQRMQMIKADNDESWRLNDFGYKEGRDKINDEFRRSEAAERASTRAEQKEERDRQYQLQVDQAETANQNAEKDRELRRQQIAQGRSNQYAREVALGNGKFARISHSRYIPSNIGLVFDALPEEVKNKYLYKDVLKNGKPVRQPKKDEKGNYMRDEKGKLIMENVKEKRTLSENEMLHVIGQHVGKDANVRNAWLSIGGEIDATSVDASSGKNNTPPSRRKASNNTPPSRR